MDFLALTKIKEIPGAPEEFQVLPAGEIEINGEEPARMDEAAAQAVIASFMARGNDMVIDYEHQSLKDGESPAAGWVKKMMWRGAEGLWLAVEWTQKAKEYLVNREYRYFSPVLMLRKTDRKVMQLINVALTNTPAINNLRPIVAKLNHKQEKEEIMIAKLRKLLGLADDAGEDKVLEAATLLINKASAVVACKEVLEALGAKADAKKEEVTGIIASLKSADIVACKEVLEALGAKPDAKKEEVIQVIASLKAPGNVAVQLSQEVATLKTKIADMEQQDLIGLALKEGKTSPEELGKWGRELAKKSPDQFKAIVLSRPAGSVIPVTEIIVAKDQDGIVADDVQKAVNKMMGVSEEVFAKYNK